MFLDLYSCALCSSLLGLGVYVCDIAGVSQNFENRLTKRMGDFERKIERKLQKTAHTSMLDSKPFDQMVEEIRNATQPLPVHVGLDEHPVMMHLTDKQLTKSQARYQAGTLRKGPYPLGRCALPSELYLVQALADNMLTRLVAEVGGFHVFDTHNTPLMMLDGGKADLVVVRDTSFEQEHLNLEEEEENERGGQRGEEEEDTAAVAASGETTVHVNFASGATAAAAVATSSAPGQLQPTMDLNDESENAVTSRPRRKIASIVDYTGLDYNDSDHQSDPSWDLEEEDASAAVLDAFAEDDTSAAVAVDVAEIDTNHTAITATNTALLIELKPHKKLNAEAREQTLRYLQSFLNHAPLRQTIFAVLTDLQTVEVYSMTRDPERRGFYAPAHHGDFTGNEVYPMLKALLSRPNDVLDCEPLIHNGQQVEFIRRLGRGAFGRVLQVMIGDEEFAMKVPYKVDERVEHELTVLQQVVGMPNVPLTCEPIYVGTVATYLLTRPIGRPRGQFEWTRALVIDLLRGVARVHRDKSIVHRDIRPNNVVWDEESDKLVLIDWGCAVDLADCKDGVAYCGSRAYKAYRLFCTRGSPSYYTPAVVDDLGSLLLLVAAAFFVSGGEIEGVDLSRFTSAGSTNWLDAWRVTLPLPWWTAYQDLGNLDYDAAVDKLEWLFGQLPELVLVHNIQTFQS